jgi:hypothetical protein
MSSGPRYDVLRDLIAAREPIEQTLGLLRMFPWDSEWVLVVLYRSDVARILQRYLQAELSAEQCVAWADAIEARDDIGFETDRVGLLKQLIFELANPKLAGPLSHDAAHAWLRLLEDVGRADANSASTDGDADLSGEEP